MLIWWVFRFSDGCAKTTAIAVRLSEGADSSGMDFGIPQPILGRMAVYPNTADNQLALLDALRERRVEVIEGVFVLIHKWLDG
jgi:hypothetical protein